MQMHLTNNILTLNEMREVGVGVEKLLLNLQMSVVPRVLPQMDRWRVKKCITTRSKTMISEGSLQVNIFTKGQLRAGSPISLGRSRADWP